MKDESIEEVFLDYCQKHNIIVKVETNFSKFFMYIKDEKNYQRFAELLYQFILLWKRHGKPYLNKYKLTDRERLFFDFAQELYSYYQTALKERGMVDFEDLIQKSYYCLSKVRCNLPDYIIVDEYQDISKDRFLLLQRLCKKAQAKLIVVGDDWQSIYGFSGSTLDLFTSFKKYFPYMSSIHITNTYRNSQELIDLAGQFIMKNQQQIVKSLHSSKQLKFPIRVLYYRNVKEKLYQLGQLIDYLYGKNASNKILLLARYHFDFLFIKGSNRFKLENDMLYDQRHPEFSLTCLTVHSSKGLGFDQVVIINNEDGVYGFPSLKVIDPYLNLLHGATEEDQMMEERRLFYVALTRTKNYVYLLVNKDNPSIFIQELKKEKAIVSLQNH